MKRIFGWILAAAVAGSPLLANQEPQQEKEKQKKEEMKKQSAQNPAQEPQPEEKPKPKPEKPKQEPAPPPKEPKQEEKQQQKEQQKQEEKRQKEQSKQNSKQQRQTTQQNAQTQSGKGGQARGMKIPDPKFRSSFGRQHRFRVASSTREDRRFQYGGYWFEVVEVWPAGWSFDDDCYVEEDGDDYYLVDYVHPEFRVLVIVVEG